MANKTSIHRLRKEYRNITKEPPSHITARPLPSNLLKWYFVLQGPPASQYEGGVYMGKLHFPELYPYKPPAVYMITPNGRFKCNQRLCLSMSDFHPETWNPLWSVSAVLTGLLSFMLGNEDTVGSVQTSNAHKLKLAKASHQYNRTDKTFRELFPEFITSPPAISSPSSAHPRSSSHSNKQDAEQQANNNNSHGNGNGNGNANNHHQVARNQNRHRTRQQHTRNTDNENESLVSLILWLFVFVAVIYAVVRLISGSAS